MNILSVTARLCAGAGLVSLLACAANAQTTNQTTERQLKRAGLGRDALAGQVVAVMPMTMVVRDSGLTDSLLARPRAEVLRWSDSLLGEILLETAPEVTWMLPEELRKTARKGAGMIPDPDRMGQSVLRSEQLKTVPDPLRSNLRTLMALAGGRYAFIVASVEYGQDEEGASRVTLAAVLADTRTGAVSWRSKNAIGTGSKPADAFKAAVKSFMPDPEAPRP